MMINCKEYCGVSKLAAVDPTVERLSAAQLGASKKEGGSLNGADRG
jgi:hypothetical protein